MAKAKRPVGRPTTYSQETADKICELIARGMSLRAICASADMPAGGTVHRWLAEHQDFQEQYARAREEQADSFADEIIDIADSVAPETGEVAKAKLQIDARKWKAAKLAPKKYGEKLELDGKEYWLSAWVKESSNGNKFFSLSVKPKDSKPNDRAEPADSGDIPF